MRRMKLAGLAGAAGACGLMAAAAAQDAGHAGVDAARFDDQGRLIYPADIDEWVSLGAALGLDYSGREFDPANPGVMEVVTMEPSAWRYFKQHGEFPDGAMFRLAFHDIATDAKLSPHGFATGPAANDEIHLKDSERFADGFGFYTFRKGQEAAAAIPAPNDCITCHSANGAYDATFAQFYPDMLARLKAAGKVAD